MGLFDSFNPARRFERNYAGYLTDRFQLLAWPGSQGKLEHEWVEPRGWKSALAHEPRVLFTGASGTGKTTALAFLAWTHARALLAGNPDARIPVFLSAREMSVQTLPRITDFPRGLFLPESLAVTCPRIYFPDAFTSRRVIVLIDNLDVLAFDAVQAWLKDFGDAQVVATAQASIPGFVETPLSGFRDGDIQFFAQRANPATAEKFMGALKTSGVPRALTANPFTFAMLARVWQADNPLPNRRASLFDTYAADVLRGDFETAKMLEGVALAIQRGRPASEEFLPQAKGFMRRGRNQTAEFVHELWLAYFAARALRQANDMAGLSEHLHEQMWWDTALFYAGLGEASDLVESLVARGNVALAGYAVAHAQQVRADLRESVTQALITRAWEGDGHAIAALSEMSSEQGVDYFAKLLKDKDPNARTRAAEILGWLQLDRGIEYLLPQLRDVSPDVRDRVVQALGHARTDRVVEPLLVALRGDPRAGMADTRLRIAAAKALGEVASDKAIPALIVDLEIGEPEVRAVAAESLKRITSSLMLKPLESVAKSGDDLARQYAKEVLDVVSGR